MSNTNSSIAPFLSVKDLVVEYTSEGSVIHAVNGVSFELAKGHTLALVGETGAGKTTIAKAIIGVLPDPPAKVRGGEIWLDGENLLELSEQKMQDYRGNKISMIFQDPMTALNPTMRVGDQISEVLQAHSRMGKVKATHEANAILEMVGISSDRSHEYPHQFSGGMKQRVVIAIALACKPQLLLADEPTTALDVTIQAQVLDLIKKLKEELNMAMIMVTHDLGVVGDVADDVAVIYAGKVIESGSKHDIFLRPSHPYTKGLFDSLPDLSKDVRRLDPIHGLPPDPTNLPTGCAFSPRCPHATAECRKGDMQMYEIEPGHFSRCCRFKVGEV